MDLDLFADGFGYLESPRWARGQLWFSDFDRRQVLTLGPDGTREVRTEVRGTPSGLSIREADFLVVSMHDQQVIRVDAHGRQTCWSDLSGLAVQATNDMTDDGRGGAFVGCFGYDLAAREAPRPGPLLHADAEGRARIACPDLVFANGMLVTDDGRTLIVAESGARRISSFHITDECELADRRLVADLGRRQPDGICGDAEGGIWFGSPFTEEFVRLDRSGRQTHVVRTPGRWAVACALGGPDGSTLFALTAETDLATFTAGGSKGRVEVCAAPVPA